MKRIYFLQLACLFAITTSAQSNFTKNYQSKKGNFTFTYPSYLSTQKIKNAPHMLLKLDSDNHALSLSLWDYGFDSSVSVWDDEIVSFYKQSDANYPNAKIKTSCDKVNLNIANNKKAKCLKTELEVSNTVQGYTLKQKITIYRFVHKGNYLQFMFFVMNYHDYWDKSPFTDEIMKGLTLD